MNFTHRKLRKRNWGRGPGPLAPRKWEISISATRGEGLVTRKCFPLDHHPLDQTKFLWNIPRREIPFTLKLKRAQFLRIPNMPSWSGPILPLPLGRAQVGFCDLFFKQQMGFDCTIFMPHIVQSFWYLLTFFVGFPQVKDQFQSFSPQSVQSDPEDSSYPCPRCQLNVCGPSLRRFGFCLSGVLEPCPNYLVCVITFLTNSALKTSFAQTRLVLVVSHRFFPGIVTSIIPLQSF